MKGGGDDGGDDDEDEIKIFQHTQTGDINNKFFPDSPKPKTLLHLSRLQLNQRRKEACSEWKRFGWRQYVSWQYAVFVVCLLLFVAAAINMLLYGLIDRGAPVEITRYLGSISALHWIWNVFGGLAAPPAVLLVAFTTFLAASYLHIRRKKYCRDQRGHLNKYVEDIDAALRQCVE